MGMGSAEQDSCKSDWKEMRKQFMVTDGEKKELLTLIELLDMTGEPIEELVHRVFKKDDIENLTHLQIRWLIEFLLVSAEEINLMPPWKGQQKYKHLRNRKRMAKPAQLARLDSIWEDCSSISETRKRENALRAFLKKACRVDDKLFLTEEGCVIAMMFLRGWAYTPPGHVIKTLRLPI